MAKQPVTPMVAHATGRLFADLWLAGAPIPINAVWITATTHWIAAGTEVAYLKLADPKPRFKLANVSKD